MNTPNPSNPQRMPPRISRAVWLAPLLAVGIAVAAHAQYESQPGEQVQTRGPVHEAFAEASMSGSTAGIVVTKPNRFPIMETPPDQRPEGNNVTWIPGYWGWDEDRNDYLWISGVWRDIPPGRQWVSGYWSRVDGGSQWISGFWGSAVQTDVTYLPAPPEPLELGPNSRAPGPNNSWTPGSWVWQENRYDWQPGCWVAQQQEWVWSPAHYTWTPRGYVYVPGYWDHDISHRGVMFAPVYYDQPVYMHSNYSYSPSIVIDLAAIVAFLFVQPRSNHYYYGDYYDQSYENHGIYPWHSQQVTRYGFDPMYVQYRMRQLQHDSDWDNHIEQQFHHRRDNIHARPPQTLALQVNFINNNKTAAPENFLIGRSIAEAVHVKDYPQRFTAVNADERKQIMKRGEQIQRFQNERARIETPRTGRNSAKEAGAITQPERVQLPTSPVAARPATIMDGAKPPPDLPALPKPERAEGRIRQVKKDKDEAGTVPPEASLKKADVQAVEALASTDKVKAEAQQAETVKAEARAEKAEAKADKVVMTNLDSQHKAVKPNPDTNKKDGAKKKGKTNARTPQVGESLSRETVDENALANPPNKKNKVKSEHTKRDVPKPEAKLQEFDIGTTAP